MQTRATRGALAEATLDRRICGYSADTLCWLSVNEVGSLDPNPQIHNWAFQLLVHSVAMEVPLGWNMPRRQIELIEKYVAPDEDQRAPHSDGEGGILFHKEPGERVRDPLELTLRQNCSHVRQITRCFDAEKITKALDFMPQRNGVVVHAGSLFSPDRLPRFGVRKSRGVA